MATLAVTRECEIEDGFEEFDAVIKTSSNLGVSPTQGAALPTGLTIEFKSTRARIKFPLDVPEKLPTTPQIPHSP